MNERLALAFPRLRASLPAQQWAALIEDFHSLDRHAHADGTERIETFLDYLDAEHRGSGDTLPAFVCDLAHFEWTQFALAAFTEDDRSGVDADGDLLEGTPILSGGVRAVAYDYEVHRPETPPRSAGRPVRLLLHKHPGGALEVTEIDAVTLRLLEMLDECPGRRGREHLRVLAEELGASQPGDRILSDLRACGVVLGTRAAAGR